MWIDGKVILAALVSLLHSCSGWVSVEVNGHALQVQISLPLLPSNPPPSHVCVSVKTVKSLLVYECQEIQPPWRNGAMIHTYVVPQGSSSISTVYLRMQSHCGSVQSLFSRCIGRIHGILRVPPMIIDFSRSCSALLCQIDHPSLFQSRNAASSSTVTGEDDMCPITDSVPLHPVLPPLECLHRNQTIMDEGDDEGDERTSRSITKVDDAYMQPGRTTSSSSHIPCPPPPPPFLCVVNTHSSDTL
jgi:hypothetical protein